jgi:hypothetical protein
VATCPKDLHSQKQESTFIYLFKYKSLKKQHFEEGDVVEWLNLCEQNHRQLLTLRRAVKYFLL